MGVSKCFSSWFKIPSEQGVVNVLIDLGHLTVRLHRTEGLSSYPLISFPPVGSWVKTSPTQKCSTAGISACCWWRDGIVQGQMGYTTTAGLVMPCLTCPCCCDVSPHSAFVQIQTLSAKVLPNWSKGCTSVWHCVHSMHSWQECLGCSKGPTNIFRLHTCLLKMPTDYNSISSSEKLRLIIILWFWWWKEISLAGQ